LELDHAYLAGDRTTVIDMESPSLGDPDYELAKLELRLVMAALPSQGTGPEAAAALGARHPFTGPHFDWFLTCARLQSGRFFAQRADRALIPQMRTALDPS
jgi:hypothetical protein